MLYDRRQLLGSLLAPAAGLTAIALLRPGIAAALGREFGRDPSGPDEVARDKDFWRAVEQAFVVDRSIVNLNSGGVSPSPALVQEAMKRYSDFSNLAPPYTLWEILEPQRESVRQQLADAFGCEAEEVALTRNASEGLEICQFGFDLKAGDEVLTTTHDYPRMITTFRQRERREGIVLTQIQLPIPAEDPAEVVRRFEESITSRTRLVLLCHMVNITGQVLPVKALVQMCRRHGLSIVVDGAHSFAHFDFHHEDLDCDYYATSLHKWLFAPTGTGMLYVRKTKIEGLWPLMAAPQALSDNIRKFEEIGTHPAANFLAIAEALTFHQGLGARRKQARLVYLRDRWARRLVGRERVRLHTSLKPGFAYGIATVQIEGIDSIDLAKQLWQQHRILVAAIKHPEFEGIRVSPSVFTTEEEVDRFGDALETVLRKGILR